MPTTGAAGSSQRAAADTAKCARTPTPTPPPTDKGKGVPSFDEMMAIVFCGVDVDDPTTIVRGHRALAIAKPTSKGLLTTPEHDQPDHEGLFPTTNKEQSRN